MSKEPIPNPFPYYTFVVRKGDPLAQDINPVLLKLKESGLLNRIINSKMPRWGGIITSGNLIMSSFCKQKFNLIFRLDKAKKMSCSKPQTYERVNLFSFLPFFVILWTGVVVSLMIFVIEILCARKGCNGTVNCWDTGLER